MFLLQQLTGVSLQTSSDRPGLVSVLVSDGDDTGSLKEEKSLVLVNYQSCYADVPERRSYY